MNFIKNLFPQSIKNIYHLSQAVLANFMYGFPARSATHSVAGGPSKSIKVIGVTGTNGKTTTCQMITKILEEAGHKVALASTINFKIGEREWVNKTKFTTLSAFQVQKFILDAVKAKCEYLVLETSSHSLDQYRVWGVAYHTAVITNVTREHLDYHQTMEEYRRAKLKLFQKAKTAIVNLDMERPEEYLDCKAENIFGYGLEIRNPKSKLFQIKSKIQNPKLRIIVAENIKEGINYTKYQIQNTKYSLNLPGKFNVENALAAICAGLAENISLEICAKALEKIQGIPGRLEYVPNDQGLQIIIDYAVTPDSLEKLYALVNKIKKALPLKKGDVRRTEGFLLDQGVKIKIPPTPFCKEGESKVIAVFGACGERDRGKRPLMGEIVARYADYIILTNEDPYGEEPAGIIKEIFSGIIRPEENNNPDSNSSSNFQFPISNFQTNSNNQISNEKNKWEESVNVFRILDRRAAIKKALQIAKPGDYIIVTGKGAEETMAIGKDRIEWNDKKVIMEILNSKL